MKKVRLSDVADVAGVSTSTVSRVLSQAPGISPDVRRHVAAAAERLGYLTKGRRTIGAIERVLLFSRLTDFGALAGPFPTELLAGIGEECTRLGLDLTCLPMTDAGVPASVRQLARGTAVGVILQSIDDRSMFAELQQLGVPFVLLNSDFDDAPADVILPDNERAPRVAARYLREWGHQRALVMFPTLRNTMRTRVASFCDAFTSSGGIITDAMRMHMPLGTPSAELRSTLAAALASHQPSAVFASVDLLAVAILGALGELGLRVPDDISVMGFDDLPLAALTRPPLTTMAVSRSGLGALAVRQLIARAQTPGAPSVRITQHVPLIERRSVAKPPLTLRGAAA
jgi:LacI family transcriptional regulator